jgi:hypothetical protein
MTIIHRIGGNHRPGLCNCPTLASARFPPVYTRWRAGARSLTGSAAANDCGGGAAFG